MSESAPNHVLSRYVSISNKLKKRFLRKPNVPEACEQFTSLALYCESQNLPQYAGMCWLAVAQCENEVGHSSEEITALIRAGRQYLKADTSEAALGCSSAGREFLQSGIHCCSQAESRLEKQGVLGAGQAAALALELGTALREKAGYAAQAQAQFKQAAELQRSCPLERLDALGLVASLKIEQGDYDGALLVLTEMATIARSYGPNPPCGVYADVMQRCEISQLLLLLLLQPTPHRLPPILARLLEKYTWGEQSSSSADLLSEDLSLLLQSLVLACQSQDASSLCVVESDLWPHLSAEQKHLLRVLVSSVSHGVH